MEYYSGININEVLVHVTKWVSLENIMLREKKGQTQKAAWCVILSNIQNKQIYKDKKQITNCQGLGVGGVWRIESDHLMGTSFLLW